MGGSEAALGTTYSFNPMLASFNFEKPNPADLETNIDG